MNILKIKHTFNHKVIILFHSCHIIFAHTEYAIYCTRYVENAFINVIIHINVIINIIYKNSYQYNHTHSKHLK